MNKEAKEIDIKKDLFLCSPLLNTQCSKENCYINDGPCYHTSKKEYSQQYLLDCITNLQLKIDKVNEVLNQYMPTYASCVKALDEIEFILKEDK